MKKNRIRRNHCSEMSREIFINVWNASSSLASVALELNVTPRQASLYANSCRRYGYDVKMMPSKQKKRTHWDEIIAAYVFRKSGGTAGGAMKLLSKLRVI